MMILSEEKSTVWAAATFTKIDEKMQQVVPRNYDKIPYVAIDGVYDDMNQKNVAWWTNGFYAGELWQLFDATKRPVYQQGAENVEELLDRALTEFNGLHHDVGFMWLHTAVANYRLTGNLKSRTRALHAASLLIGRFNLNGQFLRAWNHEFYGWAIIDSMMNIPLLYWATEETGDPRYRQIAMAHADTILKTLVRPDGSVGHIASFNPDTGEFIEQVGGQGFSADSAWTRGQAWALYGFSLSYLYTKEQRYLDAAKKIANYFIANVSQTDYLTQVDFKADASIEKFDASAGTCAACGMLELADFLEENEGRLYRTAAEKILQATDAHWTDWSPETDGIVTATSHSYHQEAETHVPIIYGDYFFIEGVLRLLKKDFLIW